MIRSRLPSQYILIEVDVAFALTQLTYWLRTYARNKGPPGTAGPIKQLVAHTLMLLFG
jgi:hypothetical protein